MTFQSYQLAQRAQDLYAAFDVVMQKYEQSDPQGDWSSIRKECTDRINGLYTDWLDLPDPDSFGWYTDELLTAMSNLSPSTFATNTSGGGASSTKAGNSHLSLVQSSGDLMQNWSGSGADSYNKNFADKFPGDTASQFAIYDIMRNSVNAEAAVWQTTLDDLDKLSQQAIDAMKACAHKSQGDWKNVISVIGAVVAVAGAIPTDGASLGAFLTWDMAAAGVTVVSTGMDLVGSAGDTDEKGMANHTMWDVLDSVEDRLKTIKGWIKTHEATIIKQVQSTIDAIPGAPYTGWIIPEPSWASHPGQVGSGTGLGHPQP
jgi:hypothetical protein